MNSSKEQIFREALARIGAGFYTEKGAEQHAKDIIRLADSESTAVPDVDQPDDEEALRRG